MKPSTLKAIAGVLILLSIVNGSCKKSSSSTTPTSPSTPSATTSTTTPEGMAVALVGHWYLDSTHYYSTPTTYAKVGYGFNWSFSSSTDLAQHNEANLKATIVIPTSTTTTSNGREEDRIIWTRKINNDTNSYNSQYLPGWSVSQSTGYMTISGGGTFLNGYIRSINGNSLVIADNTSTINSGYWYYWHR